jgi:hypothetical protein
MEAPRGQRESPTNEPGVPTIGGGNYQKEIYSNIIQFAIIIHDVTTIGKWLSFDH